MKHTLLICASLALAALSAQAATLTDTWSTQGGAWNPARQPQFADTGVLNPDAGSQGGARLVNPEKQGIFETVFYTFFSAPTLSVEDAAVAEHLQTITLEIVISQMPEEGPTLNFNAAHPALKPTKVIEGERTEISGHEARVRTFVWDVASLGQSKGFSIHFSLGNHVAFTKLSLTQTTAD